MPLLNRLLISLFILNSYSQMFTRFVVSAAVLSVIGLSAAGGAFSYSKVQQYRTQIMQLQQLCDAREITPTFVRVQRVVDGDTFITETGTHVRLLGPNTPEICHAGSGGKKDPDCVDDPGGQAATAFTQQLVEGKEVILVGDPVAGNRDYFGRLLRYVFVGEGKELGRELVRQGYAPVYDRLSPKTKFYAELQTAEKEARAAGRGVWATAKK